jgi:hypothetical protein
MGHRQFYTIIVGGLSVVLVCSLLTPEGDKERRCREPDTHQETIPYLAPEYRAGLASTTSGDTVTMNYA